MLENEYRLEIQFKQVQKIRNINNIPMVGSQAFSQKGVQASWDAPRTKSGCLWTPKLWGKREILFNDSLSILTYPKRNSFNFHYYYTFDILINLMVYLAE